MKKTLAETLKIEADAARHDRQDDYTFSDFMAEGQSPGLPDLAAGEAYAKSSTERG